MNPPPVPNRSLTASSRPPDRIAGWQRPLSPQVAVGTAFLLLASLLLAGTHGCSGPSPSGAAPGDRHALAIRDVFRQDRAAAERCKQDVKTDRLGAVRAYVQALRQIDLRPCPTEFQEAFLKHRYAWEEMIPFVEKYDGFTGDIAKVFELGSAIYRELSLTTEGDKEFERIRRAIAATYFEVERTALRYGIQDGQ